MLYCANCPNCDKRKFTDSDTGKDRISKPSKWLCIIRPKINPVTGAETFMKCKKVRKSYECKEEKEEVKNG